MNVTMKLTFEGLIRALRFRQVAVREDIAVGRRDIRGDKQKSSGDQNEEWRERIAKALYEALKNDDELIETLGGEHVYDHVPPKTPFPYVTLGETLSKDWSTASEPGANIFSISRYGRARLDANVCLILPGALPRGSMRSRLKWMGIGSSISC